QSGRSSSRRTGTAIALPDPGSRPDAYGRRTLATRGSTRSGARIVRGKRPSRPTGYIRCLGKARPWNRETLGRVWGISAPCTRTAKGRQKSEVKKLGVRDQGSEVRKLHCFCLPKVRENDCTPILRVYFGAGANAV